MYAIRIRYASTGDDVAGISFDDGKNLRIRSSDGAGVKSETRTSITVDTTIINATGIIPVPPKVYF
jgi:hypothetical protein